MTIFHHKLLTRENKIVANGLTHPSSIIHDNICSLLHKEFHTKTYHTDTNYHMTLNIIFSVSY